jgi:hypothetical protein
MLIRPRFVLEIPASTNRPFFVKHATQRTADVPGRVTAGPAGQALSHPKTVIFAILINDFFRLRARTPA